MIVHADDPAGPWSEPVFVPEAIGIDPDLCWDDDGACYLTWHVLDFTVGGQGIRQAPIDLETGRLLEPHYPVWQGSGMPMAEGPHLYRIGDYWYIMLAEGGTERGHCVTVAEGTSPRGPFESCPWNPVFTHRSSSHPVQNVGHADLVADADGDGRRSTSVRARAGSTPGFHVLGRETFLAGVDWVDGWPVFDEDRFDIPAPDTAFDGRLLSGGSSIRGGSSPAVSPHAIVEHARRRRTPLRVVGSARRSALRARPRLRLGGGRGGRGCRHLGLRLDDRHWCGVVVDAGTPGDRADRRRPARGSVPSRSQTPR